MRWARRLWAGRDGWTVAAEVFLGFRFRQIRFKSRQWSRQSEEIPHWLGCTPRSEPFPLVSIHLKPFPRPTLAQMLRALAPQVSGRGFCLVEQIVLDALEEVLSPSQ